MPKHWMPIRPDNPNVKERAVEVRKAANKHGGTLLFCGFTGNPRKWYALVDVVDVEDLEPLKKDMGVLEEEFGAEFRDLMTADEL